jgi:hypothetical protein
MTKLALFIFLTAAPSVRARDTMDTRRDVLDVCISSSSTNPINPSASALHAIASSTTRMSGHRNGTSDNHGHDHPVISRICERALHAHSPTVDSDGNL